MKASLLFVFLFCFGWAFSQPDELILNAEMAFDSADFEQAIVNCDLAIEAHPDTAALYFYRGVAYANLGDDERALVDLDKAIEMEPMYADFFLARARSHYNLGEREKAYKDLRACIKRDPDLEEAYLLRAELYLDEEIPEEAWSDIEVARRLAPRDPEVYCLRSEYYLLVGESRQAVKEASMAVKLAPQDAMPYVSRSQAHSADGNLPSAKADVDYAISLEPTEYSLLATRAMILDAMGDRSAALKDLERYMLKDSLAWDAYLTRAWLYMQDTSWTLAESDLQKAQAMQPEETSILDQLGYLYILKKEYVHAKLLLDTLVADVPSNAFARANLGYARLQTGDPDAALKDVQQAIKMDEYEPRSYFYRAAIYHALKKPAKACEDLEKAEELGFVDYYGEAELAELKKKACD